MRRLADAGIVHRSPEDQDYPQGLADLHDPPFGLFLTGRVDEALACIAEGPVVAIVGSRRATAAGRALARDVARGLAERGAVVVERARPRHRRGGPRGRAGGGRRHGRGAGLRG